MVRFDLCAFFVRIGIVRICRIRRIKASWSSFHPENPIQTKREYHLSIEALAILMKFVFKFSPQAWGELEGG